MHVIVSGRVGLHFRLLAPPAWHAGSRRLHGRCACRFIRQRSTGAASRRAMPAPWRHLALHACVPPSHRRVLVMCPAAPVPSRRAVRRLGGAIRVRHAADGIDGDNQFAAAGAQVLAAWVPIALRAVTCWMTHNRCWPERTLVHRH